MIYFNVEMRCSCLYCEENVEVDCSEFVLRELIEGWFVEPESIFAMECIKKGFFDCGKNGFDAKSGVKVLVVGAIVDTENKVAISCMTGNQISLHDSLPLA